MSVRLFLPPHLEALDLGPSLDIPAERLPAAAPQWLNARHPAADRALRYARGNVGLSYEQIAERMLAALPAAPATPLQTRATARRAREMDAAHRRNPDVDELIDQITPHAATSSTPFCTWAQPGPLLRMATLRGGFRWYTPREVTGPPDNLAECAIVEGLLRVHRGGLYRGALLPYLLAPLAGARQ